MKSIKIFLFIVMAALFSASSFAQKGTSFIGVSGGISVPLGNWGKTATASSLMSINGTVNDVHGWANTGGFGAVDGAWFFSTHFAIGGMFKYGTHNLKGVDSLSQGYEESFDVDTTRTTHTNYKIWSIMPGLYYNLKLADKLSLTARVLWDEFLPVLLMGDNSSVDLPEDQRRRVLSTLEMPPSYSKLLDSLHRAQVYREMYDQARERSRHREPNLFRSLVGTSRAIQHVRQMMQQVADTDASVLIIGESGTGKELVARDCTTSPSAAAHRSCRSTAARFRQSCSKANCSAMRRAPSPARSRAGSGVSSWPTAARCSSMKSATCRCRCRSSCCA